MNYINAHQHKDFLGHTFVQRQDDIILRIGKRQWTRTELVQTIGVGNMAAAGKLSSLLRKLHIMSVADLYTVDPRDMALVPNLGETTVFVAMAVLKADGFNVEHWYRQIAGEKRKVVTFRTLKVQRRRPKRGR